MQLSYNTRGLHRYLLSICAAFAWTSMHAQTGSFTLNNGISGPNRFELVIDPGGEVSAAAVFPTDESHPNLDLASEYAIFVKLSDAGARALSSYGNGTVSFIAQTQTVRSTGVIPGPNGSVNWVSESRFVASQTVENVVTFSSAAPFGAIRLASYFDTSNVNRMVLLSAPSDPNFSTLNFNSDVTVNTTGISHGIVRSRLNNANYVGWASREAIDLRGRISDLNSYESFSPSGLLDPLLITSNEPRFAFSTVYALFQRPNEPATAFGIELNPSASSATVVTQMTAWPNLRPLDGLLRNGFE
jgi:hypothetical protein